jgi:hypothetical protein
MSLRAIDSKYSKIKICNKINRLLIIIVILSCPLLSVGQNRNEYSNCKDIVIGDIIVDNDLHSAFFNISESSYPWYIIPNDDGTFENVLGKEITKEDTIPIEHTSNCISTHQGVHEMLLCDAVLRSHGHLQLVIHGGFPAYASSLMIQIEHSTFKCFFHAVYPAPVSDLKWIILSKEMKVKSNDFQKGERIYAWISVEFEETGTYRGKTTNDKYKIQGFLKPIIK